MKVENSLTEIRKEFDRASTLYPKFNSNHEGYAVLLEEVEELWNEIKRSKGTRINSQMKAELIQVGAMVVRFLDNLD